MSRCSRISDRQGAATWAAVPFVLAIACSLPHGLGCTNPTNTGSGQTAGGETTLDCESDSACPPRFVCVSGRCQAESSAEDSSEHETASTGASASLGTPDVGGGTACERLVARIDCGDLDAAGLFDCSRFDAHVCALDDYFACLHERADCVDGRPIFPGARDCLDGIQCPGFSDDSEGSSESGEDDVVVCQGDHEVSTPYNHDAFVIAGCTEVTGNLYVENFYGLDSLAGLGSLRSVGGSLHLVDIPFALHGLEGLETVGGDLRISFGRFRSLEGLDGLRSVGGELLLYQNSFLGTLHGLGVLTEVGTLSIESNVRLVDIIGLHALGRIDDHMVISGNPSLTGVAGLERVKFVGAGVYIVENTALHSIYPLLEWPTEAVHDRIMVRGQPSLSSCEVERFDAQQSLPKATCMNPTDCNDNDEDC